MSIYANTSFYVYAYLREDYTPYYIGKGSGKRAWKNSGRSIKRPVDKSRIVILEDNLTESEALELEIQKISEYGRIDTGTGILRNLTDGGDGVSGMVHSEETRAKISEASSGANHPNYGKTHSEESKRKMSEARGTPVRYNGVVYPSMKKAAEENGIPKTTFRDRIKSGKIKIEYQ
jgi:hypothetical protein